MRFSTKSLLLLSTWTAWFFGAATAAHPALTDSFVALQYLMLAASISVALVGRVEYRLPAVSFAAGFFGWLLYLSAENQFGGTQTFSMTMPGQRIGEIANWMGSFNEYSSPKEEHKHLYSLRMIVRSTMGTVFGAITTLLVIYCLPLCRPHHEKT